MNGNMNVRGSLSRGFSALAGGNGLVCAAVEGGGV